MDLIKRDLTTTPADITFTPQGVPVAGEELWVKARIYNVEVDIAEEVRVVIIDDGPEGRQEIHNASISKILGGEYKNAVNVWSPKPGVHTIEVTIDPLNEIREINSTTGESGAENNNDASVELSVNARPIVNISEPTGNAEVNGTITIEGTSWDDTADNALPGNDIARIDVRLAGYEWIELYPPYIYNSSSGGWDWFYDWDTNYWNTTQLSDGNYTLQAKAWDNYHNSTIYNVPITINNTKGNTPPNARINEPDNNTAFDVNDEITFNASDSDDDQTAHEDLIFSWDFYDQVDSNGDGDPTNDGDAFGNITTHAYDKKATYNITLNVTDEGGLYNTTSVTVFINNYKPVVLMTVSDTTPYVNDTVTFNATETYDPDGTYDELVYEFDFGDGTIVYRSWPQEPVVNHTYTSVDSYNATLTVTDYYSSNSTSISMDVGPNMVPDAEITSPTEGNTFDVNETILFNGNTSSDPNDENLIYHWDFGDDNSYEESPTSYPDGAYDGKTTYYYNQTGPFPLYEYTVSLTVTDDEGMDNTETVTIAVNNYAPVAIATSNVTEADTNESITFDGSGSYDPDSWGAITSYVWDFDDGTGQQFGQVVIHEFAEDGMYNVTLTVYDNNPGDPANDTDWVIISIANRDPVIEGVTVEPEFPIVGENIYINVTASDEDGYIVEYTWNFGDSSSYSEDEIDHLDGAFDGNTYHSYSERRTYNVLITVVDDDDMTNETIISVTLYNALPEVEIISPSEDQDVKEVVTISGTASDTDGFVNKVEVKIDDGDWDLAEDTSGDSSWSTWEYDWDTGDGVFNGNHTIFARAYDNDEGYSEPPEEVPVNVNNDPTSITVSVNLDPESVEEGGNVTVFGDAIYNTGDPVDFASINVTILTESGGWDTTGEEDGSYSLYITAPDEAKTYTVKVRAEKDEISGSAQKSLTVMAPPDRPDLTLTTNDIDFNPSSPFSGETVQITITVRNEGKVQANNILVNVYDDDPATGNKIGSTTASVSANSNNDVTVDWTTTGVTGTLTVYVVLDPNDAVDEEDEANNEASKPITIKGRPDFAIEDQDISFSKTTLKVGDTISIRVNIHNDGSERDSVNYEVWDGDPSAGGSLIEEGIETIAENNEKTVVVQWTPEEGGEHEIFVVLDPGEDVDEIDEDNNEAQASITVEGDDGDGGGIPSWLYMAMFVVAIAVVVILIFLYYRGREPKQHQKMPVAQVVQKQPTQKAKTVPAKEEKTKKEEEAPKDLMESHGGIRFG
ncbi:MAG: PKD domain-containing protein [Thermoplasmata archaeon]|nr:MAG: PKD domain-containing protein [Thermoplasmata archaeon]